MELDDEIVRLRRYRKTDIPKILEYINSAEVRDNLIPGISLPYSNEDEERWFESHAKDPNQSLSFAIERKSDGEYLGGCGWKSIDWKNRRAIVGIFLAREFCGAGYGTAAMRVIVRYLFDELNVNKISLEVFSFNQRAIRSYTKVGFRTEGIRRSELFRNGEYHDVVMMGILASEWSDLMRLDAEQRGDPKTSGLGQGGLI